MTPRNLITVPRPREEFAGTPEIVYDTSGLRLRRGGVLLRRSTGGWELAYPRLDGGRGRFHLAAEPGVAGVPLRIRWLVRTFTRGCEIEPLLEREGLRVRPVGEGDESVRALVASYLDRRLHRLQVADLEVRLGVSGALEELLDGVRRIRDVLRAFTAIMGGKRVTRVLAAELKWVAGRLEAKAERCPEEVPDHHEVLVTLDSRRYQQLFTVLDVLLVVLVEEPRSEWGPGAEPAHVAKPRVVGVAMRRLDRKKAKLVKKSHQGDRRDACSAARRLDTVLEVFSPRASWPR